MIRREFRAMNTDCLVVASADNATGEHDVSRAVATVDCYERRYSRFLAESELSLLNNDPRDEVPVSHHLAAMLSRAVHYAEITNGVFDPVVLNELCSIGYDRSFEFVESTVRPSAESTRRSYSWRDVYVDRTMSVVSRPPGAMIDFGGLAKGAAADAAVAHLVHLGGALVDLGGDVRAHGAPDGTRKWNIGYDDADGVRVEVLRVENAAIATSSTAKRRWTHDGEPVHHIIDPRTGRSAESDVVQCSVVADTTEHAEVAAKVGLILGSGSLSELDDVAVVLGVRGVAWITRDNEYVSTPGWRAVCA